MIQPRTDGERKKKQTNSMCIADTKANLQTIHPQFSTDWMESTKKNKQINSICAILKQVTGYTSMIQHAQNGRRAQKITNNQFNLCDTDTNNTNSYTKANLPAIHP